ncbi:MAG: major capsid protein [Planctomycetes bacterium]|nr:major capsid protein [Planctomycetota bacterium]
MPTLQQILGAKNLTGVIQSVVPGLSADFLPPGFSAPTRRVEGDNCTFLRIAGTRRLARQAAYGSPSRMRDQQGISEIPVKLMHTVESQTFNPAVLTNLTNMADEQRQQLGTAEIARQTAEFKQLFTNLRVASVLSVLSKGAIWFDGNGEMLPSSTGAVVSIDFGVPAGNRDQLDVFATGTGIVSASWGSSTTNIPAQIKRIKAAGKKLTGYTLRHAFYGSDILGHLLANSFVTALVSSRADFAQAFNMGEIPNGFMGLNWHPADEAFFVDGNDAFQDFWPADQVVLTPEPSGDWYEVIEGSYPIPTNINVSADASEAAANVRLTTGMFSYAYLINDPVTIKQVAGDTFLPCLKVPSAMFIADVVP